MRNNRSDLIRASEIGEYVFCARAWKLRLDGHNPASGSLARFAGEQWHRQHGRSIRLARRLRALAVASFILALVVAVALILRGAR
jgi:hypothetical protein